STYLTLALACVAIGYAQAPLLPEAAGFAGLAVGALGALYFIESRAALLSIPAANRLGGVVGAAFLVWAVYRVKHEIDTGELAGLGWAMLFVAMFGPLVLMLMAAKAARGEKHAGDYWTLHGLALAGVGLAAAFAEEPLCFVLVGLYLVAAVWSLTLFHLARSAGHVPPVPDPTTEPPRTAATSAEPHGSRTGFRAALLSAALAGAIAVPLYLLTPRSGAPKADFGTARTEIGYSSDQMVDLKTTGTLKPSTETAFEVAAEYPDGSPKTDLRADQRWRGRTHQQYAAGAWNRDPGLLPGVHPLARAERLWKPPALGPEPFRLNFTIPPRTEAHFVADPVLWAPDEPPPLAELTGARPHGWTPSYDGTFYWEPAPERRLEPARYVQAYALRPDPDLGPGFQFDSHQFDDGRVQLTVNPVERVKEYADRVVARLIASGELPAAWGDPAVLLDPVRRAPREEHHERLARALCAHLATTPDLRYTLELTREKSDLDPIEDFLYYSKAGHCQRFATALVLMLRSQGIPAVYVRGFKGCEHVGEGRYVVKQEQAHAWAEALVSVPLPEAERRPGAPGTRYHWLSLDPTPAGGTTSAEPNAPWWRDARSRLDSWFQKYVVNYTPEQRKKDLAALGAWVTRRDTLLALGATGALLLGTCAALRFRARGASEPPHQASAITAWFGELVAVLSAHGLALEPGETPLEYATRAADALQVRPGCAGAAAVPVAWAEAYYQDRFGGVPLTDPQRAALRTGLDALRAALETRV
ncbi:MAG TPA: transglutaminaseTgpA domain-containing protein, partial [Gemmata sp.]